MVPKDVNERRSPFLHPLDLSGNGMVQTFRGLGAHIWSKHRNNIYYRQIHNTVNFAERFSCITNVPTLLNYNIILNMSRVMVADYILYTNETL